MIIGNFKKTDDNSYCGFIRTLTLNMEVEITPVADKKSDKGPDYRVTLGHTEIGAAWKATSDAGNVYLSVRLEDPALPASIFCALVKTGTQLGYGLVWERKRKAKTTEPATEF